MDLSLDPSIAASYKSPAQRARVITEHWAAANLFCPACTSDDLEPLPPNTAVADYFCPNCTAKYQLKSKAGSFGGSVANSAYHPKILAIQSGQVPNYASSAIRGFGGWLLTCLSFLATSLHQLSLKSVLRCLQKHDARTGADSQSSSHGFSGAYFRGAQKCARWSPLLPP